SAFDRASAGCRASTRAPPRSARSPRRSCRCKGPWRAASAISASGSPRWQGFDPRDPWWVPAPLQGPPPTRPIRVAFCADPCGVGVAPSVAAAIRQAANWLAEAGYVVEEKAPPDFMAAVEGWSAMLGTETRMGMLPQIEKYGDKAVQHMARYFDKLTP